MFFIKLIWWIRTPGFDLSFESAVVKIYHFTTLSWVNTDENIFQQIFLAHRTVYFQQLLKTSLFSKTIDPQAQPASICLNSAITVDESAKYVQS